jgi:hypothetical protein
MNRWVKTSGIVLCAAFFVVLALMFLQPVALLLGEWRRDPGPPDPDASLAQSEGPLDEALAKALSEAPPEGISPWSTDPAWLGAGTQSGRPFPFRRFNGVGTPDRDRKVVEVEPGATLEEVARALVATGWTVPFGPTDFPGTVGDAVLANPQDDRGKPFLAAVDVVVARDDQGETWPFAAEDWFGRRQDRPWYPVAIVLAISENLRLKPKEQTFALEALPVELEKIPKEERREWAARLSPSGVDRGVRWVGWGEAPGEASEMASRWASPRPAALDRVLFRVAAKSQAGRALKWRLESDGAVGYLDEALRSELLVRPPLARWFRADDLVVARGIRCGTPDEITAMAGRVAERFDKDLVEAEIHPKWLGADWCLVARFVGDQAGGSAATLEAGG